MARLARGNVDMPKYDGFPFHVQVTKAKFEVMVYELVRCPTTLSQCSTWVPDLISLKMLRAFACSCLKGPRGRILYGGISAQKRRYLALPTIYCSQSNSAVLIFSLGLFSYSVSPYPHITVQLLWLRDRLFEQKPKFPRDLCVALFTSTVRFRSGVCSS